MAEPRLSPALYVVATPIGNLEDITLRAVRVLKGVSIIACEDTRQTQKLLNHFDIRTRTLSYHDFNEEQRAAELIVKLEGGEPVALVTDAGTPGISDPGYRIIALAIRHKVPVVPVPGPSAIISALVGSGLGTDAFRFGGFLAAKAGQRRTHLEGLVAAGETSIFYEAPHRLLETLADVVAVLGGQRRIVVARELTKVHEEFVRGPAAEVYATLQDRQGELKGEIVLLIGKAEGAVRAGAKPSAASRLDAIMREQKLDEKAALKVLAKELGLSKSEVYREVQRTRPK